MKKHYYLFLTELFIPMGNDFKSSYWRPSKEKHYLRARTLKEAKKEGEIDFKEQRELVFSFLDNRFEDEKRNLLREQFPKKITFFEEIEHEISV